MKRISLILFTGIFLGLLSSCNMHNDSCYDNDAWIGFGLVQKDAESVIIKMDDGEVLYPASNSGIWQSLKNNERVLTNFTILGNRKNPEHNEEYYVTINSLRRILFKGILDLTPANEDSIGNDPILVTDRWTKKNMLNFELKYRGGSKIHFINLVKTPGTIVSADEPVILELRHNTNGDTEKLPLSAMVTFDLSSLKIEGKNKTKFKVIAKGFDDKNFEYTSEYSY